MKLYAVGDIHGCYRELNRLLEIIHKDIGKDKAKIVFIGDYIDRGPNSFEVVEILNKLRLNPPENIEYIFLKGNHEHMMEPSSDLHMYSIWQQNGGIQTDRDYKKVADLEGITLQEAYTKHEDFYQSLVYYHKHDNIIFVHAGISPDGLEETSTFDMIWSRHWNDYVGPYEGCDLVVHGHTPVPEVKHIGHQINIDTGAVFGKFNFDQYKNLSAIRIDAVMGGLVKFKVIDFPIYETD